MSDPALPGPASRILDQWNARPYGAVGGDTLLADHAPAVQAARAGLPARAGGGHSAPDVAGSSNTVDAAGGPDVQQGDQSAPDVAGSSDEADSKTEAPSSENVGVSDGPGGYADQGNRSADTQQQGEH